MFLFYRQIRVVFDSSFAAWILFVTLLFPRRFKNQFLSLMDQKNCSSCCGKFRSADRFAICRFFLQPLPEVVEK